MPSQSSTNAQFTAPAAAPGAAITPNATAWANSAYVDLLAATSAASVLTGIVVFPTTNVTAQFEVDIATGAPGSEVVIATIKGKYYGNIAWDNAYTPLPIPIDNIASGARLSARLRKDGSDVNLWRVAITYLKKPIVGTLQTTAQPTRVAPSAAALVTLPSGGGTSWVNSAWTTLLASTATAIVVTHGIVPPTSGGEQGTDFDLGVGSAGAEVVVTTIRRRVRSQDGGPWIITLPNPLDNIASGVRVAVRWRGPTFQTPVFGLIYLAKPL